MKRKKQFISFCCSWYDNHHILLCCLNIITCCINRRSHTGTYLQLVLFVTAQYGQYVPLSYRMLPSTGTDCARQPLEAIPHPHPYLPLYALLLPKEAPYLVRSSSTSSWRASNSVGTIRSYSHTKKRKCLKDVFKWETAPICSSFAKWCVYTMANILNRRV